VRWALFGVVLVAVGCGGKPAADGGSVPDSGTPPAVDAGPCDPDAGLQGPVPATISTAVTLSCTVHDAPQTVTVTPTGTLSLPPGTSVTFAPGAQLLVHGQLLGTGPSGADAVIGPRPGGAWGGVQVDGTANVQRVTFHNGSPPMNGVLLIPSGTPTMTDFRVDQGTTGVDAVVILGGGPQLSHFTIRDHHCCTHTNSSNGMTLDAMDCDASDVFGFMFYNCAGTAGTGSNITCSAGAYAYVGNSPIDLQGNYWGGGAASVGGGDSSLINAGSAAGTPFSSAGMR
jgi:hypothetical protein